MRKPEGSLSFWCGASFEIPVLEYSRRAKQQDQTVRDRIHKFMQHERPCHWSAVRDLRDHVQRRKIRDYVRHTGHHPLCESVGASREVVQVLGKCSDHKRRERKNRREQRRRISRVQQRDRGHDQELQKDEVERDQDVEVWPAERVRKIDQRREKPYRHQYRVERESPNQPEILAENKF